ncbi:MAG: O-antigen ligase family protein [Anaerolineaceae bacterium]
MSKQLRISEQGKYLLQESIIILTASLLILIIGYTHSIIDLKIITFAAALWTILGVFWLIAGTSSQIPLKIPILVWVMVYAITVLMSIDPRRSMGQMLIMSTSIFLFLLVYDLVNRGWSAKLFVRALMVVSTFITFVGLLDAVNWYMQWINIHPGNLLPSITYRPAIANVIAPFNYLSAILGINYVYTSKRRINNCFFCFLVLSSLLMLFITSSRGGWLAALAGLTVLFFLIIHKEKKYFADKWNRLKKNRALLTGLFFVSGLLILGLGIILYKQAIHPTHGSIFNSRKIFWKIALKTFLENPLFGQGPFTYGSAFIAGTSTPPDKVWVHAHNSLINLLAEMGLLGVSSFFYLIISFIRIFLKNFNNATNKPFEIVFPAFAFLIAFVVHCMFDSLHMEPAILWTLMILLGSSLGSLSKDQTKKTNNKISRPWWVVLPITIAWIGIWMVSPFQKGVELANQNQWQAAREQLSIAVKMDPASSIAHQQLGLVNSVLASQGDLGALNNAINELNQAIENEPSWSLNYANLASLYAENDQLAEAQISAQKSVALAPQVGLYQLNLGMIAESNLDIPVAREAYQMVLKMDPEWADSDFWTLSSLRQEVLSDWLSRNPITSKRKIAELEAQLQANLQSTWAYNQLAQAYLEEGNPDKAEKLLSDASLAYAGQPSESIETNWLKAEVLAAKGDYQQAIFVGEQAMWSFQSYGVYGPGSFGFLYYAPRMFRSPAIAMEIVPQMVDVPVPKKWMERQNRLQYWKTKS